MTPDIRNFCKSLKKVAGNFNWKICRDGRLRGFRKTDRKQKHGFCPLTAAFYVKTGLRVKVSEADKWSVRNTNDYWLTYPEGYDVIDASDKNGKFSREVRDKLLNAVGI